MAKKNRKQKNIIFVAREGDREENFLLFLQKLFDPQCNVTLKFPLEKGGTSNAILDRAFHSFCGKTYAWFDEDDELDTEHKEELAKRWGVLIDSNILDRELQSLNTAMRYPILIVSNPLNVEGILIRLFGGNIPNLREPVRADDNFDINKKMMKSAIKGIFGDMSDTDYYKLNLTRELVLQQAQEIRELRLLLHIFGIDV